VSLGLLDRLSHNPRILPVAGLEHCDLPGSAHVTIEARANGKAVMNPGKKTARI
jgi:hypothetical protein